CYSCIYILQHPFRLECIQHVAQTIEVRAFTLGDLPVLRRSKRCDLVNEKSNSSLPAGHELCVTGDDKAEASSRIGNRARRNDDLFFELVQTKVHDIEQQVLFAVDVMIETCVGDTESIGRVI